MNRKERRRAEKEARRKNDAVQEDTGTEDALAAMGLTLTEAPQPVDLTKNGSCSRCGGCCSSMLSVTADELTAMRRWASGNGFTPRALEGTDVADLQCPFLVKNEDGGTSCACYDIRPAVCRSFDCRNSNRKNAQAWLEMQAGTGKEIKDGTLPVPSNTWQVFGLTGLRRDGEDVPYHNAPRCRVGTDQGDTYEFFVGRPIRLLLTDGTELPWSMVIGIYQDGLQVFDSVRHGLRFLPYGEMAAVLSCNKVDTIEDGEPITGAEDMTAIKAAMGGLEGHTEG